MRSFLTDLRARPEALLVALLLAAHAAHWHYTVDDAYISFRYAKNFVEGNGLVYNPGERVEGYTNFLWVALLAGPMAAGVDPLVVSKALGLASGGILTLLVVADVGKRLGRWVGFAAGTALAADPAFALWTTAGLETPLFILLAYLAIRSLLDDPPAISPLCGVWAGLAALTRPEGVIVLAAALATALARRAAGSAPRALLLFAVIVVPHLAFRFVYYHDLLPNTFYAKVGGGLAAWPRGARYLGDWLFRYGAGLLVLLALIGAPSRRLLAALVAALLFAAYVVAVGGDGLSMFRFALFLSVPVTLLAAEGAARAARRFGGAGGPAAAALLLIALALPARNAFAGPYRAFVVEDRARVELHWVQIGKWLARHADPARDLVALPVAGAIAYYGGIPAIDMLGITDRHIAHAFVPHPGKGIAGHEKHDMPYVLSRKPTFFIHYPFLIKDPSTPFTTSQFDTEWNPGLAALRTDPVFDKEYRGEVAEVRIPGAPRLYYFAFFRRRVGSR